ncbi:hypothetical protein MBAV_004475 [Candidatus Magnetobacterium bavaricum]|uniref:Uncharacterized protein n=1 Tax=Candidatus Magnetobacterium bavaricum TaxID=29290 RepID=A0A0F3GRJ9_9BACT|nr:hypothetical protein MBAV_004475 [Candidatus Magnetobacterium bavaricum]
MKDKKAKRKNVVASRSVLPDIHATASVLMGWTAKSSADDRGGSNIVLYPVSPVIDGMRGRKKYTSDTKTNSAFVPCMRQLLR